MSYRESETILKYLPSAARSSISTKGTVIFGVLLFALLFLGGGGDGVYGLSKLERVRIVWVCGFFFVWFVVLDFFIIIIWGVCWFVYAIS